MNQGSEDGHDERGQDRERVADGSGLEGGLGLLDLAGVPAGGQVAQPADGRNSVATPARIPTIQVVRFEISPLSVWVPPPAA